MVLDSIRLACDIAFSRVAMSFCIGHSIVTAVFLRVTYALSGAYVSTLMYMKSHRWE